MKLCCTGRSGNSLFFRDGDGHFYKTFNSLRTVPASYEALMRRAFAEEYQALSAVSASVPFLPDYIAFLEELTVCVDGNPTVTFGIQTDYVEGKTLAGLRPVSPDEFCSFARALASALDFLYAHGVCHLDLTRQNILIPSQKPLRDFCLVDFTMAAFPGISSPGAYLPVYCRPLEPYIRQENAVFQNLPELVCRGYLRLLAELLFGVPDITSSARLKQALFPGLLNGQLHRFYPFFYQGFLAAEKADAHGFCGTLSRLCGFLPKV